MLARFGVLLASPVCTVWRVVFVPPLDHGVPLRGGGVPLRGRSCAGSLGQFAGRSRLANSTLHVHASIRWQRAFALVFLC